MRKEKSATTLGKLNISNLKMSYNLTSSMIPLKNTFTIYEENILYINIKYSLFLNVRIKIDKYDEDMK